jgi:hypothetical protein
MKNIFVLSFLLLLGSCASTNKPRGISSVDKDLSGQYGQYLGVADYNLLGGEINKAVRLYLKPIEGEQGSYNAVLLEYVNLIGMAPKYILSNKAKKVSKKIGFLKNITSTIATYKVVPGEKENTFEMWPLIVVNDQIVVDQEGKPRILTLSTESGLKTVLSGATISSSGKGQPNEIFFPKDDDDKINGVQYELAKFTYDAVKLNSTWREDYLAGPYLSQYANVDDVVLDLEASGGKYSANFFLNKDYASMAPKKREAMFTSKKSAFLTGKFEAIEPQEGMFIFKATESEPKSISIVEGRIGLFIDIFDASKTKLKQDVVELALINPMDPKDFLMYYEHPENGEGGN